MKLRLSNILFGVKVKIILIFSVIVILPSILFFSFIVHKYSRYILEHVIENKRNIMEEAIKNMDFRFDGYENTTMTIYYNDAIKAYIDKESYTNENPYVMQFLNTLVNSDRYLVSAVMELDGQIYNSGYNYRNLDEYLEANREKVLERKGKSVWLPTETMAASYNQHPDNFVLARALNSQNRNVGTLWLFFSDDIFKNIFKNKIFTEEESDYYLLSTDCKVVTCSTPHLIGKKTEGKLWETLDAGMDVVYTNKENERKIVVCVASKKNNWRLISLTDEKITFKDITSIKMLSVGIGALYIVFLMMAYLVLLKYIFEPMKVLSTGMHNVSRKRFEGIAERNKEDEMGMLIHSYNDMILEIQTLITNIRNEEKAKNEEKLKVLSMQIGPHFIYNTLNTIKWMAAANKQENIKKMVESFLRLMQSVTYTGDEEITIREEKELLDSYIYIQKMRFLNFEVEYELPAELEELKILKFILQPFVENCILHAFKRRERVGLISIRYFLQGEKLHIEVADNGIGFSGEAGRPVREERRDHIGIRNVIERINLHYGSEYGVRIESAENKGAVITVVLPVIRS